MNKTAIKNFAIWARNKLIADISYRAGLMGITADGVQKALPLSAGMTEFYDIGTAEPYSISGEAVRQRSHLVDLIRAKERETNYKVAYKYVLEEVAYTWFNRLIAVRFMEVNDYLPSHIRVLSSDSGKMEPDLVTTPFDADLSFTAAEEQEIYQLKQKNKLDEVFRILFIKQCNALNEILPALFEKTSDYTELLLNLSVIDQDGVVYHLVHDIPEADFNVEEGGQVEIIGWMYQYYNTEPKNEAFAKSGKISKEEIPAVTQLFTPDWIVRYMVENSVGRLWIEHLRALDETADEAALAASFGWKYYLPEAQQEPEVEAKLRELRKERASLTPEQITMIDPCMGSGHILVYAFEVLMQIYENAGYGQRDAAKSILENNLFGLDIDDRAYQLAYFAVMMKAREYNRRILNREIRCKVYSIQDSNGITDAALADMGGSLSADERQNALKDIKALIMEFKNAKECGSILNIEKHDWNLLRRFAVPNIGIGQFTLDIGGAELAAERLRKIIDIAEIMANQYLASVTNPPYMSVSTGSRILTEYARKNYAQTKNDTFAIFIQKCLNLNRDDGITAMITQAVWLFIPTYEKLRDRVLAHEVFNLLHIGYNSFPEMNSKLAVACAFCIQKNKVRGYKGQYFDLDREYSRSADKECVFFECKKKNKSYIVDNSRFLNIPGHSLAYWISASELDAFSGKLVADYAATKTGMATTDNTKFLRLWSEVSWNKIKTDCHSLDEAKLCDEKWYPYNKGGGYRKWYGLKDYVVNWQSDGRDIRKAAEGAPGGRLVNIDMAFKKSLTWSAIAIDNFSIRYSDGGAMFDAGGPSCFVVNEKNIFYLLGYLNSNVAVNFLNAINPTINYKAGTISNVPFKIDDRYFDEVTDIVQSIINISKEDWDSYEHSWDFKRHPLLPSDHKKDVYLSNQFSNWERESKERFATLKMMEERLNSIFIHIFGLEDVLSPEEHKKSVSINLPDLKTDIKSLLSYAVGCILGRYSLDKTGLAYAGGVWNNGDYISFEANVDNVIPITDEEYLKEDIVSRLCTWLKRAYGESTLEENLDFIAKALSGKGNSSREIIRNYFLNDFFKDHCKTYSVTGSGKRPIYWLFDSGKQNGFKALIYLHRYNADTIGNIRIDYLHRMQRIYESEINRMQDMIDHSTNSREVAQATKRREKLTKQLKECREYDEKLAHLALSRIELDLDDGVKVNYRKLQTANDGKFYEVLADSKNIMSKK